MKRGGWIVTGYFLSNKMGEPWQIGHYRFRWWARMIAKRTERDLHPYVRTIVERLEIYGGDTHA